DALQDLNRRESALRGEAQGVPTDNSVRAAYDYSMALARHLESVRKRLGEAEEYVSQKQTHLDQVSENRKHMLSDLGIGHWTDRLSALQSGIAECRVALAVVWPVVESLREVRRSTEWVWASIENTTAKEARQKEIVNHLEQRAVAAEVARDTANNATDAGFGD